MSDERIQQIERDLAWLGKEPSFAAAAGCRQIRYLLGELRDARAETARLRQIVGGDGRLEHDLNVTLSATLTALWELSAERDDLRAKLAAEGERRAEWAGRALAQKRRALAAERQLAAVRVVVAGMYSYDSLDEIWEAFTAALSSEGGTE